MSGPYYVIQNTRTGLFWNAGVCDRKSQEDATPFENNERCYVLLQPNEKWKKI